MEVKPADGERTMTGDMQEPQRRTVIRGGIVVTGDPGQPLLRPGDVWIAGDRIEAVVPSGDRAIPEGCAVIEAGEAIVMPGLIDSHRHLWQTPIRGLGADLVNPEYSNAIRFTFGPIFGPEEVYAATLAGALEALEGGVTTILDWAHIMNTPAHADAAVAALRESGIRAVFAYGPPNDLEAPSWWRRSERRHPEDVRRVRAELLADDDELVTMGMAVRSPHLLTREVMVHDWTLARELGLRITVDGGLGGGLWSGRHHPIRLLHDAGLMGPDTTYVHCNNLEEDEYAAIAQSGGSVSISPCAEMHVGHGLPATGRCLAAGIRPSLSLDYVTAVGGDLFGTMRSTLATERGLLSRAAFDAGKGAEPWELRTGDVFEFATHRGAVALGMERRIGTLAAGKQADIVLLNTASFRLSPVNDPLASIVLYAGPADVDTVMVAGRIVKRDGKLVRSDATRIRADLIAARDRLYERAGLQPGQLMKRQENGYWGW